MANGAEGARRIVVVLVCDELVFGILRDMYFILIKSLYIYILDGSSKVEHLKNISNDLNTLSLICDVLFLLCLLMSLVHLAFAFEFRGSRFLW